MPNTLAPIAILDDDLSSRDAILGHIQALGYDAQGFASAGALFEALLLGPISCLVLDYQMPGLNGLEVQSRLLAGGFLVPIIFLTACTDPRIRTQALAAGALGLLAKPAKEADLQALLQSAVGPIQADRS
ncbi:response regulator [Sphingomonas sp. RT2P30]|uniref:response regulator n=1 Tax=Parasphingomonas halimpatiens TaxID=3096162 RepID=UPI002FC9A872